MHDLNYIRDYPVAFDNSLKKRGLESCSAKIIKIDEAKRKAQTTLQNILAERNNLSKEIGILKSKKKKVDIVLKKVEKLKIEISTLKELEKIKDEELQAILSNLPNIPADDIPVGFSEKDNNELKKWGKKPNFSFNPKRHFQIGEKLNLMDFTISPHNIIFYNNIS